MGAIWDWLLGRPTTLEAVAPQLPRLFEANIPAEILGIETWTDPVAPAPRVTRKSARQVPAVKRARDLICGTLGGIPLELIGPDYEISPSPLLDQPEADVPRSVTFTRLYEDLLYEGIGWWQRVENDYRGYPSTVRRLDPCDVDVKDGKISVTGREVTEPGKKLIRFDSPNGSLLEDGARAIRTLLRLESAAANYADDPMPQGYFAPVDGADPLEDAEILDLLAAWKSARQRGATGYVPAALKYNDVQFSPEQLQMADARQHAVREIARLTGIDAEDLSVSTTSRTYFNGQDRRLMRISDVLGPYSLAVTDRLRMGDITPRGYQVRADFAGFLRADDTTRLRNYKLGVDLGLYTLDQIAQREGLPAPARSAPAVGAVRRRALTAVPDETMA